MSLIFTILCKQGRPADWALDFRAHGLPFDFWLEDVDAWTKEMREAQAAGEELDAELERALDEEWSFVARFNFRPQAAELVELCAHELVAAFGGFFYDNHSGKVSEPAAGVQGASGNEVVNVWHMLATNEPVREHRIHELATREWSEAAAEAPEAYAEANDWSDLD